MVKNNKRTSLIAKIVILGEIAVGKTSLRRKYMGRSFQAHHLATLGADFSSAHIDVKNNVTIEAQIWDIAGQPSFKKLRTRFLLNATAAILVFDLTRPETLDKLPMWLDELLQINNNNYMPLMIIGNKTDLTDDRLVHTKDANKFIEDLKNDENTDFKFIDYIETSAKTGEQVKDGFERLAEGIRDFIIKL